MSRAVSRACSLSYDQLQMLLRDRYNDLQGLGSDAISDADRLGLLVGAEVWCVPKTQHALPDFGVRVLIERNGRWNRPFGTGGE